MPDSMHDHDRDSSKPGATNAVGTVWSRAQRSVDTHNHRCEHPCSCGSVHVFEVAALVFLSDTESARRHACSSLTETNTRCGIGGPMSSSCQLAPGIVNDMSADICLLGSEQRLQQPLAAFLLRPDVVVLSGGLRESDLQARLERHCGAASAAPRPHLSCCHRMSLQKRNEPNVVYFIKQRPSEQREGERFWAKQTTCGQFQNDRVNAVSACHLAHLLLEV